MRKAKILISMLFTLFYLLLITTTVEAQDTTEQKDCQGCGGAAFQTVTGDHQKLPFWNCPCNISESGIGSTSQQMTFDSTKVLWINEPDSPGSCYTWEILSGGGELSSNSGLSTVYTAPSSNYNCTSNAVIGLSCKGEQIDFLPLAITNTIFTCNSLAMLRCEPPVEGNPGSYWIYYDCRGRRCTPEGQGYRYQNCLDWSYEYYIYYDIRNDWMKELGCCPSELLE